MTGGPVQVDPAQFHEAFLEEATEHLETLEAALLDLEADPLRTELVDEIFRAAHSIKGGAATFGLPEVARFTHSLEGLLDRIRQGALPPIPPRLALLLRAADIVRSMLLSARSGERSTAPIEEILAALDRELAGSQSVPAQAPAAPAAITDYAVTESTIRVPIDKIDCLMDLVGELVIAQAMVSQTVSQLDADRSFDLREAVAELERRTRELQARVIAIRMVPVGTLLGRFPRLVRDLALTLDKRVTLELVGADTELDRGVIERITDPLTHLLRNAVDHGIERPAVRRSAGKPELGTITITARHQGGNIVIDVADDGAGLDGQRLRQRAVQLGILRADELLTEDELLELIYRPGFSTASTLSDVSGRGVGMDVVHRNIQALNGSVRIRSELGRGTCFHITLPLTLAIVDGLCLAVGSESYILPLVNIVESLRVPPERLKTVAGRGETVLVRGEILPLVRLHRLFAVQPRVTDPGRAIIVIVEHEARRVALLVDDIQGQVQAVIKSLETNYRRVEGVMGATILGDGRIGLILDVLGLLRMAHTGRRAPAPARAHA